MASSRALSHGFWMKSRAPRRMASTASSTLPQAVMTTTGSVGVQRWQCCGEQVQAFLARGGVAGVVQVHQDDVELVRLQAAQDPGGRGSGFDRVSLRLQKQAQGLEDVRLIVGHKNARQREHRTDHPRISVAGAPLHHRRRITELCSLARGDLVLDAPGEPMPRYLDVIVGLQVEPVILAESEVPRQSQGCVRSDRPPALDNLAQTIRGHAKRSSELIDAQSQGGEQVILEGFDQGAAAFCI